MSKLFQVKNFLNVASFFCLTLAFACSSEEECRPGPEPVPVDLEVVHFEKLLKVAKSPAQIAQALKDYPELAQVFYQVANEAEAELLGKNLYEMFQHPTMDTLYGQARETFKGGWLEEELAEAFGRMKSLYPDFRVPRVYTTVTGVFEGMEYLVNDSMVVVGLDFFIGPGTVLVPPTTAGYLLSAYTPEKLVPQLVERSVKSYVAHDNRDRTLLAEMLFYGKAHYLTSKLLPCTHDSILMDYSSEQLAGIYYNNEVIWAHFIENELLFDTSNEAKVDYTSLRPFTAEISQDAPPRLGRWLGLEIVRQYMAKNEGLSIQELMATEDARMIFTESEFRPLKGR